MRNTIDYGMFDNGYFNQLIRYKHIIPYTLSKNEKYVKDQWYYNYYYGIIYKVINIYKNNKGEFDSIYCKTDDECYNLFISQLDPDYDYMIKFDDKEIYNRNIIGDGNKYTGAEIIYWFFMNNIHGLDDKYNIFWKYVDMFSQNRLNEKTYYYIDGELYNGIYIDCKIYKYKDPNSDHTISKSEMNRINQYMMEQKSKDLHNTKRFHEKGSRS